MKADRNPFRNSAKKENFPIFKLQNILKNMKADRNPISNGLSLEINFTKSQISLEY
jgi:hypothetical protein